MSWLPPSGPLRALPVLSVALLCACPPLQVSFGEPCESDCDDGYRCVVEHAVPVLAEFGMTATMFVVTAADANGLAGTVALDADLNNDGNFTDPGTSDGPFTCTVNYGDGSGPLAGTVHDLANSLAKRCLSR